MDNYLHVLMKQYARAQGLTTVDFNDKELRKDVIAWAYEMSKRGNKYLEFLNSLGVNYNNYKCAEYGKTELDTLAQNKKMSIITPEKTYIDGMKRERIFHNDLVIEKGKVSFSSSRGNIQIPNYVFSTFMSQNIAPFKIKRWCDIHNSGNSNIIVGAYGSVNDKDIYPKLNEIEVFRRSLDNSVIYDYDIIDDTYVVAVASLNAVKEKVKRY